MKKISKVTVLLSPFLFSSYSCARTATVPENNKVVQFTFKVKGNMVLNRSDITYYLILNAPKRENNSTPVDINIGPRINGPDITKGTTLLEGRLPFIYQFPGDQPSNWTDFFYITFAGGKTTVGRGRFEPVSGSTTGNPVIYDRNYANQNTKLISPNAYQIEFSISDLNNGQATNLPTLTGSLAVSDNIEVGGLGSIYDSWRGNIPFSISLTTETPQNQFDTNPLVLKKILSRPDPVLPFGVNANDVDISEYSARVICDVTCDVTN